MAMDSLFTAKEITPRKLTQEERDREFWNGIAQAASAPAGALGFFWGKAVVGDVIISRVGQHYALNDLRKTLKRFKDVKVKELSREKWILTKDNGAMASINPLRAIDGWYAKDLGELTARLQGYDYSPDERMFYNIGSFLGSVKSLSKLTGKGVSKIPKMRTSVMRLVQTTATGLTYESLQQLKRKSETGEFSFQEVLDTGALFAMFGFAEVGLNAAVNARNMQKWFRTPEGQEALKTLTKDEIKHLSAHLGEVKNTARYMKAKADLEGIKTGLVQNVPEKEVRLMRQALSSPHMSPVEIDKMYKARTMEILGRMKGVPKPRGAVVTPPPPASAAPAAKQDVDSIIPRPSENIYSRMPIEMAREHAAYGVKLAKDHLESIGEIDVKPATAAQKRKIILAANKVGLDGEALKAVMKYNTGSESLEGMTVDEAQATLEGIDNYRYMGVEGIDAITKPPALLTDPSIDEKASKKLLKITGSEEAYNRVIYYSNALGGAPSNADIPDIEGRKKKWMKDLNIVGGKIRKHFMKEEAFEPFGKEPKLLNPYQAIGYALDKVEARTGIPLRRKWSDLVADIQEWRLRNEQIIWDAIHRSGTHRLGKVTSHRSNILIGDWLDAEEPADKELLWNKMDEGTQRLAKEAENILQTEGATAVRWAEFKKWDYAARKAKEMIDKIIAKGKEPTAKQIAAADALVKAARPYNAPKSALTDGRTAFAMGQGLEWLEAQTWGTRKNYFMHQAEFEHDFDFITGGSVPQELFRERAQAGTLPIKAPGETITRKGGSKVIKTGNVMLAILKHLDRLTSFAASFDSRIEFWDAFTKANPSREDLGFMRDAMDALIGISPKTLPIVKSFRFFDRWFWRSYLVGDPRGSLKFAWRQLWQNLIFGPSQFNTTELAKTILRFPHFTAVSHWLKNNPAATQSFKEFFNKHVAEDRSVYRHMIMKSQELSGLEMTSKTATFFDMLGFMPSLTDRGNRLAVWPIAYRMAERNITQFANGKIGIEKLWSRLAINSLTPGQSLELQALIDKGDYPRFMDRYAEYKVENIHFRYNPLLRGVQEMGVTGRTMLGLIVFPRGVFNIALKNGLEPMMSKQPRRFWSGFKTILKLLAGTTIVDRLQKEISGKSMYDFLGILFGYSLLSPGASNIIQLFDETSQAAYQGNMQGKPPQETAARMAKIAAGQLETFIPLCDVMLDAYKAKKDYAHYHLWDIARQHAMNDYEKTFSKPFGYKDRSVIDKLRLMFFEIDPKEDDEFKALRDALSSRNRNKLGQ